MRFGLAPTAQQLTDLTGMTVVTDHILALPSARAAPSRAQWAVQLARHSFIADLPRQALWAPVFLGLGIAVYFAAPVEPPLSSATAAAAALAVWVWCLRREKAVTAFFAGAMFWGALGFACGTVRTAALATPVLTDSLKAARIEGRVEQVSPLTGGDARIVIQLTQLDGAASRLRARILLRDPGGVRPGAWISLKAGLRPPPGPVMPGGFDFARALWFQGIGASGFALGAPREIPAQRPLTWTESFADELSALRRAMSERIRAAIPGPNGPVATAFLTGERTAIDEETIAAYRDSSLAHVLSISGLHMVMAGFGFFTGLRLALAAIPGVALRHPVKKYAAAGALIASFGYLMLSGAATPTVRAFVMIALVFGAMMLDRPGLALRNVAIAALAILIVTPESLLDVSFQMSFAAVIALVAAFEWWSARPKSPTPGGWLDGAWSWLAGSAATSLIAGAATTPFAAFHFHRIADYGVVANMLALPAVSFVVMPAGVVALLAMPFGLEHYPLQVMDWGLSWVTAAAFEVASWPGAAHATASYSSLGLNLMILGGLWVCLWTQAWRVAGFGAIALGLAAAPMTARPDVYVAAGGRIFAVRQADGTLAVPRIAAGRFDAGAWLTSNGEATPLGEAKARAKDVISCTAEICTAAADWGAASFIRTRSRPKECVPGAIVVAPHVPVRPCAPDALVLGPEFLARSGAVTLTREADGWRVDTVAGQRGARPWVAIQ
jgi:competence protein ComEC